MKALALAIWLLSALSACAASPIPKPTVADVQRGSRSFPGVTLAELSHGRSLYVERCGGCHTLKPPLELSPERWQAEVSEMRAKNGVKLNDADAQAIVRYLAVAATPG